VCYSSIMGQIIIEIAESGTRTYRIRNEETVKKLIAALERAVARERETEEDDDILGLWTEPKPFVKKKSV
jgi:hypothetical protein